MLNPFWMAYDLFCDICSFYRNLPPGLTLSILNQWCSTMNINFSKNISKFPSNRKTLLLVPGVDHFSNSNPIKQDTSPSIFKSEFNRELTQDFEINLIQVRFQLTQMLHAFEKWSTPGTKSGVSRYIKNTMFIRIFKIIM